MNSNNQMLQQAIAKSPYTQRQLAAFLRVSDSTLSKVISGSADLPLAKARYLGELLGTSVDELFPKRESVELPRMVA